MEIINIATFEGPMTVVADVFGDYAAHKAIGYNLNMAPSGQEWTVTHVPTGCSFWSLCPELTEVEAKAIAFRLDDAGIQATTSEFAAKLLKTPPFHKDDIEIIKAIIGWVLGCDGSEHARPDDMTMNHYQGLALQTAQVPDECTPNGLPVYYAMGLAGEAGEYLDKVKKAWRNQKPLDREAALRELGDVLWYIATNANALGATLEEVARMNLAKLADRHARGVIKSEGDDR